MITKKKLQPEMSSNPLFSTWAGGRLPSKSTAVASTGQLGGRIIKQGKQTRIQTEDEKAGPKYFNARFIAQLDHALVDRATELEYLHGVMPMSAPLPSLINGFFAAVIKSNDATTNHRGQEPPKTLNNARKLLVSLERFKDEIIDAIPESEWGLLLCMVLHELSEDIEHFVRNIERSSGIENVFDGEPTLRNRPTNRVAQEAYASIIAEHMALHGPEEFPKPAEVQRRLKLLGHSVAVRTLGDWKKQFQNNVMGDFVQNRKRQ
jgi:hypothetical protein